jgi:hypothetical protein
VDGAGGSGREGAVGRLRREGAATGLGGGGGEGNGIERPGEGRATGWGRLESGDREGKLGFVDIYMRW